MLPDRARLAAFLLALPVTSAQGVGPSYVLREDFDAPGSSWSDTAFPELHLRGGTAVAREPLSVTQGAPDTRPMLPINAGGDAEGRFYEASVPGAGSYALAQDRAENVFRDGAIRAAVAFGVTSSFGSQSVSLLLRARTDAPGTASGAVDAYGAILGRDSTTGQNGIFALVRYRDELVTVDDVLAEDTFHMPAEPQNYLIEFELRGTRLSARLWRLSVNQGSLTTAPVQFASGLGPLRNQLVAWDGAYVSGRAGLSAFTRSTNSVFVDDVAVKRTNSVRGGGLRVPFLSVELGLDPARLSPWWPWPRMAAAIENDLEP